jgi:hypothetical protein
MKLGTELFRNELPKYLPHAKIKDDIWVSLCKRFIADYDCGETNVNGTDTDSVYGEPYPHIFLVSDLRDPIEEKGIWELNGAIIKIHRSHAVDAKAEDTKASILMKTHTSETRQNDVVSDYDIYNTGTLEELENTIVDIIGKIVLIDCRIY